MNMDLYEAARSARRRLRLRPGRDPRVRGRSRASATAASGGSRPASWTRWRRCELPAIGYGIRYEFGIFEQRIDGRPPGRAARQLAAARQPLGAAAPRGRADRALRRPRRACTTTATAACARDWVDTRDGDRLPYDSFIVGHRTDTVNTLRLWAARATRDFDLQFFNEGDYRARRRGEDRHREHLQGPLPERPRPTRARSCA